MLPHHKNVINNLKKLKVVLNEIINRRTKHLMDSLLWENVGDASRKTLLMIHNKETNLLKNFMMLYTHHRLIPPTLMSQNFLTI